MKTRTRNIPQLSESDIARFWEKVNKEGPLPDQSNPHYAGLGNCWVWTERVFRGGYGIFWVQNRNVSAHRVSFFLKTGRQLPDGLVVMHKCDRRRCVNPDHLIEGTLSENSGDCSSKGRITRCFGDSNGSRKHPERLKRGDEHPSRIHREKRPRGEQINTAKLTASDVVEIRRLSSVERISQRKLAAMFSIHQTMVGKIIRREAWEHVPQPEKPD